MSEWRQKGFVQDSDEEEDESQIESQHSRREAYSNGRVERVVEATGEEEGHSPLDDEIKQVRNGEEQVSEVVGATTQVPGEGLLSFASQRISPRRPKPSPITPTSKSSFHKDLTESPDPLQSSPSPRQQPQKALPSSPLLGSPTYLRRSSVETQTRHDAAASSQIIGDTTTPTHKPSLTNGNQTVDASVILGEFGVAALSDNSEDELNRGQRSDAESDLSDYPSDLSDTEVPLVTAYAEPHRRTAVQVVIPSSTALQHQLAEEEARRQLRQRKPIQLHPYMLEGERYRREVQSRGLKPVPRARSPQRRPGHQNTETQEEEFNPFRSPSSSPPDAEIFVSTPVPRQTSKDHQSGSSLPRSRSNLSKRRLPDTQLRVPQPAKRRRLNETLTQALATPARTSESSPVPRDIWSVPPNSPPYSSSPPLNAQLSKLLSTSNTTSLPTPSNSSTFQDEPQSLPDSDSDPIPRSVQRSGAELRRPARIVLSDDPSSDSDVVSSDEEQADGDIQKVSKKIRGVLPASWLRIDRQAQERRQILARKRARRNTSLSPDPPEPQRGVAQKVTRPVGRPSRFDRPTDAPGGIVVISDESDHEAGTFGYQPIHNAQNSGEDATALAAMLDDRYADSDDDLASMEHDRLQLPTLGGSGAKRKRQPKITDAIGNTKRNNVPISVPRRSQPAKLASGHLERKRQVGRKRPRSTPPPALSVMDIELPSDVPQFLKLARRAARRDLNQGRQSPRRKQIRLHTVQDTEDANVALCQWRKGLLKPSSRPRRSPLATMTDNRTHNHRSSNAEKNLNEDAYAQSFLSLSSAKPRKRKNVAPTLQLLQRNTTLAKDILQRRRATDFSKVIKRPPSRRSPPPRTAQLEGDEKEFGLSHRKIAFHRGLQHVQQQDQFQQPVEQQHMNPQVARFLADDEADVPPLPLAEDVGELHNEALDEANGNTPSHTHGKRFRRKPHAKRLDVDAREYRQPSEPTFEPTVTAPALVPAENKIEQQGCMLQGLGPVGTRYPTTFDITPLKSDTYFHSETFIGSEGLRQALSVSSPDFRDLDEHAGYCTISHGSMSIRCGPWSDETHSRIYEMTTAMRLPEGDSHGQEITSICLEVNLASLSAFLRALASYITGYLSFHDPIDRKDFVVKMQHIVQSIYERISTLKLAIYETRVPSGSTRSSNRVLSYLLVVSVQIYLIAQHSRGIELDRTQVLNTIKDTARCVIRDVVRSTPELHAFHDKNKLHKERENGIRDADTIIESVVVCMHTLERLNVPSFGFWDLVSQELVLLISPIRQVQTLESIWITLFSLLPFVELDLSGIPDRTRITFFDKDNWTCIRDLLKEIFGAYLETSKQSGSSINEYVRASLTRCYVLINDWHWKRPEQMLNVVFDFFGKHGLKPLRRETSTGSVDFLQGSATAGSPMLGPNEGSFHIALKCLVTGLQGMKNAYPEKKIRSFVFRLIPNHGRTYPKDQPLQEESLAALRNHYDLLSTLYCVAPPSCRPKLDLIRTLISHETSHREACRVNVRAWANLTTFQLATDEPYTTAEPFALWYKEIMHQTLKQYRLAKTEADDYLKSRVLDGTAEVSAILVRQTMERNQEQVIATLRDSIVGMRKAVERAKDQANLATFLVDSDIINLLELPHLEDDRLLCVIRDTLLVFRQYASLQRAQAKQHTSQPRSEESQDYGDFPDLDDLDDTEKPDSASNTVVSQTPRLDFIQTPLWHLMSNAFGAERSPDDNLLMDCVDTWVLIAGDQVETGGKTWSHYVNSFSQVSWQQLRPTEQTRRFGPYFMSALIACDPAAYEEHRQEFLTALLLSLADRESMLRFQYRLLDAIVRTDPDHPLLINLPFFKIEPDGSFDISGDSLRSRRLALISSLLSNMREDVYATSAREPSRTSEVRRAYSTMLMDFMGRLKSNYQQLQQGATVTGAYVEFVQKIVQFLKQYTGEICPVLPFFTDSVAFPLPSADPTYVVGRLCGYAPKVKHPGTAKQLSVFIQTVAQQAASDNQQVYLVNQLVTALCTEEAPAADRVALRTILLQAIFPAYIEEAFQSRAGYLVASPIIQCLSLILDTMVFDLRVLQPDMVASTVHSIISIAHAFIRGTERLKGDKENFQHSSMLAGLVHMFEVAKSVAQLLHYIVSRTMSSTGRDKIALITYLEEFSVYTGLMINNIVPDNIPSYQGDAHTDAMDTLHADILDFSKRGLENSIAANWTSDQNSVWFGQGQAKKEVHFDFGTPEEEKSLLAKAIHCFHAVLLEMVEDKHYEGVREFEDGLIV